MLMPVLLVTLSVLLTFFLFRQLDHWMSKPPPSRPKPQPNEDDPEFMAWIERKLKHRE